jgi:hypothetical protein
MSSKIALATLDISKTLTSLLFLHRGILISTQTVPKFKRKNDIEKKHPFPLKTPDFIIQLLEHIGPGRKC